MAGSVPEGNSERKDGFEHGGSFEHESSSEHERSLEHAGGSEHESSGRGGSSSVKSRIRKERKYVSMMRTLCVYDLVLVWGRSVM